MTILEFLNNATNFIGTVLKFGIIAFLIVLLYGFFMQEEYDEDYVTFTVSCKSVLSDTEHYPANIVNYCVENRSDIK